MNEIKMDKMISQIRLLKVQLNELLNNRVITEEHADLIMENQKLKDTIFWNNFQKEFGELKK